MGLGLGVWVWKVDEGAAARSERVGGFIHREWNERWLNAVCHPESGLVFVFRENCSSATQTLLVWVNFWYH